MGLLLGCTGIGLILAFGAGFIVGMWYQASEHITPFPERPVMSAEQPQAESEALTFYSTLTDPAAPKVAPGSDKATARAMPGQSPHTPPPPKVPERVSESAAGLPGTVVPKAPIPSKASERASEPAATNQGSTGKALSTAAGYRVQVGSFQYRDQAESLRHRLVQKGYQVAITPTAIPGKGVWYRVQVGGAAERGMADRLAQQLAAQERLAGVVVDGSR
jgi:cell division septation protein DedD